MNKIEEDLIDALMKALDKAKNEFRYHHRMIIKILHKSYRSKKEGKN